ncbi:MAG TPA: iron ABC transporter substrate-binding protein [Tepidimicrobium sp.]|nr:iron ABC transporter substrate-binding protein [Tepidimicrobium sp.]
MRKGFLLLIGIVILSISLSGCWANKNSIMGKTIAGDNEGKQDSEDIIVTDLLEREVQIPANPTSFVNMGSGCLRLYTYVAPLEKLAGIEQSDKERTMGTPYSIINSDIFMNLPTIGQGGSKASIDPEQILMVKPDVIFSTHATDAKTADELQEKTGIPVVVLSYGVGDIFDKNIYDSLILIGKVTGEGKRAEEVVNLLEGYHRDLTDRTRDILEEDKPSVYVGALGNKGPQGIESTRGDYTLLNILNAKNVVDETGSKGSLMIDKEQLLSWNPEYIFIDLDGYHIVEEDYKKNANFYDSLSAVKSDNVYVQLPYIRSRINLETAIADAYYMGTVLYPERFADIDPEEKADEIYVELLGSPFYNQMVEDYREFGTIRLGE